MTLDMRKHNKFQIPLIGSRRRWRGHVDRLADGVITGWASDLANPTSPVEVAAVATSGRRSVVLADNYRDDLERAGFGSGRHGFTIDVSSWTRADGEIAVQVVGSGRKLNSSPLTIEGFAGEQGNAPPRDGAERWRGHVDTFGRDLVTGWVVDLTNLHRRVELDVVSRGGKTITGRADIFRGDLNSAGYGDGFHGFRIDLHGFTQADCPLDLVTTEDKFCINLQPLDFDIWKLLEAYDPPASIRQQMKGAVQAVLHNSSLEAARPIGDSEAFPVKVGEVSSASRTLFTTANPAVDPEGLISKFMQYESFRIEREKQELAMAGILQDRLQVAMWYLVKYLRDRQYKFVLPLSAAQQNFLNRPLPLAGYPAEVTVALFNVVRQERPDLGDLDKPAVLRSALYWWCCERTPRDRLDDSLTTKAMVVALSREEQWIGQPFPFNVFMTEYFARNVDLHDLDMSRTIDRAVFFMFLVVKSFTEPCIARFLPRDTLRFVLQRKDGSVAFDSVIARLVGQGGAGGTDKIDGEKVRSKGEALLALHGLSLRRAPTHEPRDFGECLIQKRDLSHPPEAGVAVIGPLHKTSGLGQATRLSHDALKTCEGVTPTALIFDLDNPAPVGYASTLDSEPFVRRREVNLIHLNAESVPLAFAFEQQEIFSQSYNIGYFFWELNMIPKCHHLALELLDEIWVSSEYNRAIYAHYTDKPVVNVGMAVEPLPRVAPAERAAFGLEREATVFLTIFDSFSFIERKNPMGVLEAFQTAFPRGNEAVQLLLKTQNRGRVFDPYQIDLWRRIDDAVSEDPRIIIINETLPYREVLALKLACDCYVSLHRSEGWGFGMLEAMSLGRPVIATAYSGNMDFCTPETTYLVDYDLIGVREAEYIFVERGSHWAQPRRAHAAQRMREVAQDRAGARTKGETAAAHVERNFSIEAIARRYGARLAEIRALRSRT